MNTEYTVLDHGYVKLIGSMGTDETIIDAARMSTNGGFVSWEPYTGHPQGDAGLLSYLYKHGHMTPFEMCELAIEVQAPIFVVREWFRHRSMSYNEASARYAKMPDLHYIPAPERLVRQAAHNKQAGGAERLCEVGEMVCLTLIQNDQRDVYINYETMLGEGLAREVARINTPVSRYTRFRAKANLRNWLQFLALRLPENAQEEIRVYAQAVAKMVQELWPRTWALFEEHTLYGRHLSRTEAATYDRLMAQAQEQHREDHALQKAQAEVADLREELKKHREACERLVAWFRHGEIPADAQKDRDFTLWVLS